MKRDILTISFIFSSAIILFMLIFPILNLILSTPVTDLISAATDNEVILSIYLSLITSTIATIIAFLLGTPLAYLLARKDFYGKNFIDSILDLPILIPHTVAGIALLALFGPRGIIGRPLSELGIYFIDTIYGIIVAMLFVSAPLYIKAAKEAFESINPNLFKVARSLGASPVRAFFTIDFSLAMRGIFTGATLCWARALSEFGAVIILAYYPYTAPVIIFKRFTTWGLSASKPISALLLIITLGIFLFLRFLRRESID